jgi:CheY-like chemotaxis protein
MPSIPRIITVDPQAAVSRMVHAAVALFDRPVIQVDVPGSYEALDEIQRGGYALLVTALHIDKNMQGFELALRVRQLSPSTAVVIIAEADALEDLDDETRADSPFVYMRRPVDAAQFLAVVHAALQGLDVLNLPAPSDSDASPIFEMDALGPVPVLDSKASEVIIDTLLADVGARAVVLCSRTGQLLLERGVKGSLDRKQMAQALLPSVQSTIGMGELVGGHIATLQYFDGDSHDVFVLSVGYHHFLALIFDGQAGARQFGVVTRYGRRAAEDLKALLGSAAYTLERNPTPPPQPVELLVEAAAEIVEPVAVKAETWEPDEVTLPVAAPEPEPPAEPIADFDASFLDGLSQLDSQTADDLFDPERLAQIANEARKGRGPLTYEEARELGIVP